MLKQLKFIGLLLLFMSISSGVANAIPSLSITDVENAQQNGTCTGIVKDATGETVIGASVVIKGTTNGTITGMDGDFSLKNVKKGDVIQISFVGYETLEITWDGKPINATLRDDTQKLQEVVVTALGIKREKKALGYAIQDVKGDALIESHENNIANALTGKIAGVQITRSSNGPAGSSKIQLRGNNSVTGLNQPLIVVDGIPMDNFTGASNNDYWNPSADMGNGLSDINPDDIESMSVLKGASAAALYGSRAGNGVILITTKKGTASKGLGLTITGTASVESLFTKPNIQSAFGQGTLGKYDETTGGSWGPEITGQTYKRWDGQEVPMQAYDNLENYFKNGVELQENVTLSQQYGKTSIYASATNMNNNSMTPEAKLKRTNLMLRGATSFGKDDRWTFDGKVQYIKTTANNRPISGNNSNNSALAMYNFPRSLDIRDFENCLDADNKMVWWNATGNNPYWMSKYKQNQDSRDRFLMNASLKYQILDWLSAEVKAGTDMYTTETTSRTYSGNSNVTTAYGYDLAHFYENNFSYLVTAQKDHLLGNWGGALTFGGNLMSTKKSGIGASTSNLVIQDKFSVNNGADKAGVSETFTRKKINSLYGTLQLNYDGWVFVDATFRNDWTSALAKENRSFFYPSVSVSYVFTDMVSKMGKELPSWFTFGKLRASYAQVGNDMDPYQLYNLYSTGTDSHAGTTASSGATKYDATVRNELIKSWEVGAELKFLDNRLGIDFAWYKSNATNQLMNIPINSLSGYSSKKINAGNIQNQGVEIMLNATPIRSNSFTWNIGYNVAHNKNTIIDLYDNIETYQLGGYDNIAVYAKRGGNYGEIWGTKYLRVTDQNSPYYGQMLLTSDGMPQGTTGDKQKIGDQQATCNMGLTNSFSYKNWNLSFLIDARIGGQIFSGTMQAMKSAGTAACTVVNGKREDMTLEGVYLDSDGNYQKNTSAITPQQYWQRVTSASGNNGIGEANIYDATNVRLRNISLSYSLPSVWLKNTILQSVRLGMTVTNVWMIHSKMEGLDPESVFATSTNATGYEYAGLPTTRNYVFNVSIGF